MISKRKQGLRGILLALLVVTFVSGCEGVSDRSSDSGSIHSETMHSENVDLVNEENAGEVNEFTVSFIDVGKGDCILLQSAAHTVLIDTGYEETAGRVLEYFEKQGVERIDEMIVTHFDKDHDGGAPAIMEALEVSKVYLPDYEGESKKYDKLVESLVEHHIEPERLAEDISYTADGVNYQIYVSGLEYDPEKENDNDMSLAISVTYGGDSWFFAGDLEKKGIKEFLERHGEIRSDILKMPHHGQYVSNTDELLEQVRPKIAVITDGAEKPAEEKLIELLEETQVEYYRSMMNGTIVIKGNGEGEYKTVTDK